MNMKEGLPPMAAPEKPAPVLENLEITQEEEIATTTEPETESMEPLMETPEIVLETAEAAPKKRRKRHKKNNNNFEKSGEAAKSKEVEKPLAKEPAPVPKRREADPAQFFNKDFAFQSQRFIEPSEKVTNSWDFYWHLSSQNTVIFKNLDRLIPAADDKKDLAEYEELKAYFRNVSDRRRADNPLAKFLQNKINDEYTEETYASNIRKLLYFYDKYYEPKLIEDIEALGKAGEAKLPQGVDDKLQDFYVKAYPFLDEREQADVYSLLVKDEREVSSKVIVSSFRAKKRMEAGPLADKDRQYILLGKKQFIVESLSHLPLAKLGELHSREIAKLLDLVSLVMDEKHAETQRMRYSNPNYNDPQIKFYREIELALQAEQAKREEEQAAQEREGFQKHIDRVVARFVSLYEKSKPEDLAAINNYVDNIKKRDNGVLLRLLTKASSNKPADLATLSLAEMKKLSRVLSELDKLIIEGNKKLHAREAVNRATELRGKIVSNLKAADLPTAREYFEKIGGNPKDVSVRFAAADDKKPGFRARQKYSAMAAEKLEKTNTENLVRLDMDLSFANEYKALADPTVLNSENRKKLQALAEAFEAAQNKKEKKAVYDNLMTLKLENLNLSFAKLRNDLLKNTADSQRAEVKKLAAEYKEAADSYNEKVVIYNKLADLVDEFGLESTLLD